MEFTGYKDCSVALAVDFVNSYGAVSGTEHLTDPASLEALLERHRSSYGHRITDADVATARRLRARLREAFATTDERRAAGVLNALLAESGARPYITNHDGPWHLHFAPEGASLADWLAAYTAMGLAIVVAEDGFDRLKTCAGERCEDVFVDMSKNRSRRFCSAELCGNRASVAAYRRRQRARDTGTKAS